MDWFDRFIQGTDTDHFKRNVPNAIGEATSLTEKVNQIIDYLTIYTELTDEMLEKWNEVYHWIKNEGLEELVRYRLNEWLEDGTLEYLINENLLDDLKDKIESIVNDLDQFKQQINDDFEKFKQDVYDQLNKYGGSSDIKSSDSLYQKLALEPMTYWGGDEIFEGAERAFQGMTYIEHDGKEKLFLLASVDGSSWGADERKRIIEFEYKDNGEQVDHVAYSKPISLSHQGISAFVNDSNELLLYISGDTGGGKDQGKGFTVVKWNGSQTNENDKKTYQVFPYSDEQKPLSSFNHATPAVSPDGKYIVLSTAADFPSGLRYTFIYDRQEVEESNDPKSVDPLNTFQNKNPPYHWGNVVQDVATDGSYVYIATGAPDPEYPNMLTIHHVNGMLVGYTKIDGSIGDYTFDELNGLSTLGTPKQLEPEGLTLRGNDLLYGTTDVWEDSNGNYTKRSQKIHRLNKKEGNPINKGYQTFESPSEIHLAGNANDISYPEGDALQISMWNQHTQNMREVLGFHDESSFWIFDGKDGANENEHTTIKTYLNNDDGYVIFRGDRSNEYGAGFNAHTIYSEQTGRFSIHFGMGTNQGEHRIYFYISEEGNPKLAPREDNVTDLGTPSKRFQNIYAGDGNIKTSDRNHKQDIKPIDDKVLDAWADVEFSQYKMIESVKQKGNNARVHFGVIAQHIMQVFKNHDLNAFDYGIIGYDEWEGQKQKTKTIPAEYDKMGNLINYSTTEEIQEEIHSGHLYTIRADECLMLETALNRREMEKIKKHVYGDE